MDTSQQPPNASSTSTTSSSSSSGPNPGAQQPPVQPQQQPPQVPPSQSQPQPSVPQKSIILSRWRHLVTSAANSIHKAEKAGENSSAENCRELEKTVVNMIRTRIEFCRTLTTIEIQLQGKAQEREALEGYVRTQPRLGKRKRQRSISNSSNLLGEQPTKALLEEELHNYSQRTEDQPPPSGVTEEDASLIL